MASPSPSSPHRCLVGYETVLIGRRLIQFLPESQGDSKEGGKAGTKYPGEVPHRFCPFWLHQYTECELFSMYLLDTVPRMILKTHAV